MCWQIDPETREYRERHPEADWPPVLLAIIRIKQRADDEHGDVLDCLDQVADMRPMLDKLIVTHIDSDNYSDHLFSRAEQLSAHLETYKKIVDKVNIGEETSIRFQEVSNQFNSYLHERLNFKTLWIESMETIRDGKRTIDAKAGMIDTIRARCNHAYAQQDYLGLRDVKADCDLHFGSCHDLMDLCIVSGKQCKEYCRRLYEMLNQLEVSFHEVIQITMKRLDELKHHVN